LKKPRPGKEKEAQQAELALLRRIATALEQEQPLASLGLRDDEEKAIRSFQLLTLKPELVLVNCGDEQFRNPLPDDLLRLSATAIKAAPRLELELSELSEEEQREFMQEMGLASFQRDEILRT